MCTCVSLNKEEYLDAKSDDTLMCLRRKKDTLVRFPYSGTQKATMAKKRKNGGPKSPKKFVFSLVLEKDFVSRDTLFGRDEK